MPTRTWQPITPEYVSEKATEWERRDLPIVRRIQRREQLYHLDWQIQKDINREYLVAAAPQVMANRAIDKLCSQPPLLNVLEDQDEATQDDPSTLAGDVTQTDPQKRIMAMALQDRTRPVATGEQKEALLAGLWLKVEEDQRVNLTRIISRSAIVDAYVVTRVIHLMPDECHTGEISLRVQTLDRRFYHENPGPGGGAPDEVLYSRRERAIVLKSEGWEIPINAEDNEYIRFSDYWRRVRVPKGANVVDGVWDGTADSGDNDADDLNDPDQWESQVWHCIVMDGGLPEDEDKDARGKRGNSGVDGMYAKEPTNMTEATGGVLTQIPYVHRKARPSANNPTSSMSWSVGGSNSVLSPYGINYEGFEAHSFIEIYDWCWESMNRIRSYRAHGVRMAVDPPIIVKSANGSAQSVEVRTPGAQNTMDLQGSVEPWTLPNLDKETSALDTDLRSETQQATFAAASLGQGAMNSSGIMTEKLQEAGSQSVKAYQELCEGAIQDTVNLLGMMARAYMTKGNVRLPGARKVVRADFSQLTGQEIVRVHLPSMSFLELMQSITAAKSIAEPGPDGWPIVSRDTAREISGLPYPVLEGQKVKRQRVEESDMLLETARSKFFQQSRDQQAVAEELNPHGQPGAPGAPGQPGAPVGPGAPVAGGPPLLANDKVSARINLPFKDMPPQDQAAALASVGLPSHFGTPLGNPAPWMPAQVGGVPAQHPMGNMGGAGPIPAIGAPQSIQPPAPPSGMLARFAQPVQAVRRMLPMFRRAGP